MLPFEQRKRVNWTSSNTFMRLDGILKAFCESRKQPLKSHSYLPAIGADVREVTPAEGCRQATVFFFRDSFFHNSLPGLLLGKGGMQNWVRTQSRTGGYACHTENHLLPGSRRRIRVCPLVTQRVHRIAGRQLLSTWSGTPTLWV